MNDATTAVSVAAVVIVLALAVSAMLSPGLRRIALRNVFRWPASTTLVVAGSMIGTAMIAGSLVIGDTTREGTHSLVQRHLGEIDLIVTLPDPQGVGDAYFDAHIANLASVDALNAELDRTGTDASVNGVLPAIREGLAAQSLDGDDGALKRAAPQITVIAFDWNDLARFGENPPGIAEPDAGAMLVSDELASAMDLSEGDQMEIFAAEDPERFTVEQIIPAEGISGVREVVFTPDRGTALINLEDARRLFTNDEPLINTMFISNTGPITESHAHDREVQAAIGSQLRGADERGAFLARAVKDEMMEPAEFGLLFLVFGSFVILAGLLLLVNIYVMLAEERRRSMGIVRALGMRRGHLVRLYLYEGLVYSAFASIVGVLLGLGIARVAVAWMNQIMRDDGLDAIVFPFTFLPATLLTAGLVGMLLGLATIFVTSLRTSRINIVGAMKNLEEPSRRTRSWWSVIWPPLLVLAGGAVVALAILEDSGIGWIVGPSLALIGAGFALRSLLPARVVLSAVFLGAMVYVWLGMLLIPAVEEEMIDGVGPLIVTSLILMFSAIGLVALNLSSILAPLRWGSARAGRILPATRMILAYPGARPLRTSLTILMFTMVVFVLTLGQVMLTNFERNFLDADYMEETELGGFSAVAFLNPAGSALTVEERIHAADIPEFQEIEQVSSLLAGQVHLPDFRQVDYLGPRDRAIADRDGPLREQVIGVDEHFLRRAGTSLVERAPEYENDADVWNAMADDPSLIVGSTRYFGGQHGSRNRPRVEPGETLLIEHPATGQSHEKRLIAIFDEQMMPISPIDGILLNQAAMQSDDAAGEIQPQALLLAINPSADHRAVADALEREFVTDGLWVEVVRDWLGLPFWLRMMQVMGAFLYFGLFVGIAGLAIVSARAVHQRRRDIGTLRAIGFRRGMITGYFLGEAVLVALLGILVGVSCGLLAGYGFYLDEIGEYPDATFYLPVAGIAWTSLAILIAAVVFTVIPAIRASRLSVVEALRPME